jgi:hypothetical protein
MYLVIRRFSVAWHVTDGFPSITCAKIHSSLIVIYKMIHSIIYRLIDLTHHLADVSAPHDVNK